SVLTASADNNYIKINMHRSTNFHVYNTAVTNDKRHPVHTNNQTNQKAYSVQHNSHPHNTDKNIKSSTLAHY
ncbi:hypothetical protein, partial [Corynebacterium ammoniagenes]|uniref:hypothetical protein n=1 Tax=Corynebacterium ammoniagenes TaxID=1697 RepID=UPI001B7F988B